jgi:hypothetical protein
MRNLRKTLGYAVALASVLAACSSSTPHEATVTDSGASHDAATREDSNTAHDAGGGGTNLSGTASLTFTPSFAGSAESAGSCPVCGGLPTGDGGSTGSFPSGPASYHGVVVVLSDDPSLEAKCTVGSASFDDTRYHYLTIQVLSTGAVSEGSYGIHSALSQSDGGVSFGYVDDSVPVPGDASHGIGYHNEDNGSGTVTITGLGATVTGTFDATGLELFGGGSSQGNLSGSFSAPSCPGLAAAAFQAPCGGCPG